MYLITVYLTIEYLLVVDCVFVDCVFVDCVFVDCVFVDRVFVDCVFVDCVFVDRVFVHCVFVDRVFVDCVFVDRVFQIYDGRSNISAQTDMWGLGTIAYELCQGHGLFHAYRHLEPIEMRKNVITPISLYSTHDRISFSLDFSYLNAK